MSLIEHSLFGTTDKVQTAIDRLRAFEQKDPNQMSLLDEMEVQE